MIKLRHAARKPGKSMDFKAVKAEVMKMQGVTESKVRQLNKFKPKERANMEKVVKNLGQNDTAEQEWLVLTPHDKLPKPAKEAFPRPQKRPDGSYIYDRVPSSGEIGGPAGGPGGAARPGGGHHGAQMLYKKRAYEEKDASASSAQGGVATKVPRTDTSGRGHVPNVVPPKGRVATLTRISSGGQKQVRRTSSHLCGGKKKFQTGVPLSLSPFRSSPGWTRPTTCTTRPRRPPSDCASASLSSS